jgi:NAD(P)H dehydrogenase (quinone)
MILITAATGQYGRLVVEALLQKIAPKDLAVAVRHPEKARDWRSRGVSVRQADYDDLSSLHAAFEGVDDLLFVSSPEFDTPTRMAQHERVIEGAKRAKVRHVAYTSFLGAQNEQPGGFNAHYLTERALEKSGLKTTFLRHPFYTDSLVSAALLQDAMGSGSLKDASGGKAVNTASRADLAAAAAAILSGAGEKGKPVELTGTPWTFAQLAEAVAQPADRFRLRRSLRVKPALMAGCSISSPPVSTSGKPSISNVCSAGGQRASTTSWRASCALCQCRDGRHSDVAPEKGDEQRRRHRHRLQPGRGRCPRADSMSALRVAA